MAISLGWAEGTIPPEVLAVAEDAPDAPLPPAPAAGDEPVDRPPAMSRDVPSFSIIPAAEKSIASVTGGKAAVRPVPDARRAVVFYGDSSTLLDAAVTKLGDQGWKGVSLAGVLQHTIESDTPQGKAVKSDVEAGKLIAPADGVQMMDEFMSGDGPYVISATGGGAMAVLGLLSRTHKLAPVGVCFGSPGGGEATLAAAYRTGGRELLEIAEGADVEAAVAEVVAKVGRKSAALANEASSGEIDAKQITFVLGGPGSGKGTQCALLSKYAGYAHFSAGDLLRDEVASGSDQGKEIEVMIKEGKIVPAQVTIDLLKKAMESRPGPYLIDGFPRSMENCKAFETQVGVAAAVLFFDVSETTLEERLLKRGETSGRDDDNKETILKRFKTFQEQSMPVVEYLGTVTSVHKIGGDAPKKTIFQAACTALGLDTPDIPDEEAS